MNCELLATCNGLGYLEEDTYHREPDCLESVKDLIRYLRHEDDTRDIRQQLGAGQILQKDLLPLVIQHHQEGALFDACIRLMVNLTQPARLCFGKVPDDPAFRHHFLQVESSLQAYKEAFANEKVFGVLSEKLYTLLQLDWEQRQEEDNLLIERILLLVRNVLHVPADPSEEKSLDDDASLHDKLLWAIHMSGMDDLIKFLASSPSEHQWSMHILEVISLLFREQTPEQLASTGQARSAREKDKDSQELEILRQRELAEKRSRSLHRGNRHSRFGGSYVVQGLKSIGDNDVIYHRGLHTFKDYSHDYGKAVRRVPKRRQAAGESEGKRRSALNVRLFLKEFCTDFLQNCYNSLMYQVKDGLIRERAQQHDETYYLWAVSFFMGFNRSLRFQPELVSETVSIRTFHYIEQNLTNYYEMMVTDRREASAWARRMHLALKAYQELLMTVNEMDRSKDENIRESARVIKSNIFYLMEFREIFLALLRRFDETRQPRSFLQDLVETTHLFLRMLERFCKGRNHLLVQKKKVHKRRKSKSKKRQGAHKESSPEALEEAWQAVSQELRAIGSKLSESVVEGAVPFDAASEVPLEDQRAEAMVRIQDILLTKQGPEALGLLRAAREVWPEGDVFGAPDLEQEEELELLKQILFANLPRSTAPEPEEEEAGEEAEEEELESVRVSETEFNFLDYIKRFANANVLKPYIQLLKSYHQNSSHTNHCIVRMLHRIAYDLKMEPLLFQLSVFCVFNRILGDPSAAAAYKELVTFAKFVLSRFFTLATRNDKAYVELLFWKNVGTVREMTEGYRKPGEEDSDGSKKRVTWTEEEEEELRQLYMQHCKAEDADVIESLLPRLQNPNRTRRQVANHLVQMGLVHSIKDLKKERKGKGTRIVLWTEEQELELQTLFEEFKDTADVLGSIMKLITAKRSKPRLVEKLLSMGLVSDRKELYKKPRRRAAGKPSGMTEEEFFTELGAEPHEELSEEEEEEEEESESEGEESKQKRERARGEGRRRAGGADSSVQKMVHKLRQEGVSSPLLWLQHCLNRTAADREEDGQAQPVPLVPLTEDNEDAMENKHFQRLLKKLGIRAPANEQESFWRIPAKLTPAQLRVCASSLCVSEEAPPGGSEEEGAPPGGSEEEGAPPGGSEEEGAPPGGSEEEGAPPGGSEEEGAPPGGSEEEEQGAEEQRAGALRALLLARKRKRPHPDAAGTEMESPAQPVKPALDSESESDSETSREPERRAARKQASKRSRVLDSDEEEEEGSGKSSAMDLGGRDPDSDAEERTAPAKRRRHRIEDDDED
ncbi:protein timeless homolog [Acipenser ruthenus]|uniref:protein timeless homolog n=1 Tax=Acipenser ruthenus TaxID=7906 RepID=UPI002740C9E1|nr:protein timeless homolog [Acipenser ruthenus]XP_058867499.1 protein timeless homolog [Acipenser ruthenus]XP_058867500.1 protein timeless homolog [Acipenser ruthenus]